MIIIITGIIKDVVSIIIALLDFKYYSIIFGCIIQAVLTFIFYYNKIQISPGVKYNSNSLKKYGLFQEVNLRLTLLTIFFRQPYQLLAGIITPAIQPIMSDYETKPDVIKTSVFKNHSLISRYRNAADSILLLWGRIHYFLFVW